MERKVYCTNCTVWWLLFLCIQGVTCQFGKASAEPLPMKGLLEAYDYEFFSSYTLGLLVCKPTKYGDWAQGVCTSTLIVTGKGGRQALIGNMVEIDRLVYHPKSFELSHDKEGNYVVNICTKDVIYLGSSEWKRRCQFAAMFITQDNDVASSSAHGPMIDIYPVGHLDAANFFFRHILPLGRGYSQFIDEVTTVVVNAEGIANVEGRGHTFSPHCGTWRLEVDTNRNYLVRRAAYTPDGRSAASMVCESEGYWDDAPIPLCRKGRWRLSNYELSVSLVEYSQQCDSDVLEGIADEFDSEKLPKGTLIQDYRVVDGEGLPLEVKKP